MRRVLVLLLAFALASSPALSQSNHDPDSQKAAEPQTVAPDTKPERAAASPGETGHGTDGREKHEERCEYRGPNWFAGFYCFFALHDKFWVAFGTLVLAIGTGVLGFATIFLWRATRDLVRDARLTGAEQLKTSLKATDAAIVAANAAQKSADHIPIIEGAYIFPEITGDETMAAMRGFKESEVQTSRMRVHFQFKNFGKTPAIIQSYHAGLRIPDNDGRTPAGEDEGLSVRKVVLGSGETTEKMTSEIKDFNRTEYSAVASGSSHLHFSGEIRYADIWGSLWLFRFDWEYSPSQGRFIPDNQTRKKLN
jgi:hypothetical protein